MMYRIEKVLNHNTVMAIHQDDPPWDIFGLPRLLTDSDAIDRFLRRKLGGRTPDRAALKKLSDALLRRGFSWSDIRPALNRLGEEIDE